MTRATTSLSPTIDALEALRQLELAVTEFTNGCWSRGHLIWLGEDLLNATINARSVIARNSDAITQEAA